MPALTDPTALLDAVMNELRVPVSNQLERDKFMAVMGYVYADICAKQDWWWLVKRFSDFIVLKGDGNLSFAEANPAITATVNFGVPSVTLSSAPNLGYLLLRAAVRFTNGTVGADGIYRVGSTYTQGDTLVPLVGNYASNSTSGVAFTALRDRFEGVSDIAKALRLTVYTRSPRDLKKIGIEEMSRLKQWDTSQGPPQCWTIFDFSTENDPSTNRVIWVHPYPDANYKFDLWYKRQATFPTASTTTIGDVTWDIWLPVDYQQTLLYGTLSRCYTIFLNDGDRGTFFLTLFNDVMALMAAQQREYAHDNPGVDPGALLYRHAIPRGRTYTSLGRFFDTLPFNP